MRSGKQFDNLHNRKVKNQKVMNKLQSFLQETTKTVKQFPVEFLFGATMFVLMLIASIIGNSGYSEHVNNLASLSFQLLVVIYSLHKVWDCTCGSGACRRINFWGIFYIASYFFFLPLLFIDLDGFIGSRAGYLAVSYLLAFVLLYLQPGGGVWDNERFAQSSVNLTMRGFSVVLIGGIIIGAIGVITVSIRQIFDVNVDVMNKIFLNGGSFVGFVVVPLLFCSFMNNGKAEYYDETEKPVVKKSGTGNVLRIIIDYIMSPTILIYTLLLFIYFITIVFRWSLPKGDIAYIVSVFIAVALIGIVLQYVLPKRYYNWFYKNFSWVAIPPLVMYWIGTCYRIAQYGFTQERVYLVVIGVLMTLFILMLLFEKSRNFRAMLLIAACAVAVFTYVPGIAASSIGIRSQTKRFEVTAAQIGLLRSADHKITDSIDVAKVSSDTVLFGKYEEAKDIYDYLCKAEGKKIVEDKYGKFNFKADAVRSGVRSGDVGEIR